MPLEPLQIKLSKTPQVPPEVDAAVYAQLLEYHAVLKAVVDKVNEIVEAVNAI